MSSICVTFLTSVNQHSALITKVWWPEYIVLISLYLKMS
jgi:hypothetical protein